MAGLFGLDEDASLGLLTAALAAMSARGVRPGTALAQGGLLGLGAMQNAKAGRAGAERQKLQDDMLRAQLDEYRRKTTDAESARGREQEWSAKVPSLLRGPSAVDIAGSGAPTVANAAMVSANKPDLYTKYMGLAEAAMENRRPETEIKMYLDAAEKNRTKYSAEPRVVMKDGRPVYVQTSETADPREMAGGYTPPPKFSWQDTGSALVPRSDYDTNPQAIPKTMNPGEAERLKLARQQFGYQQGRDRVADARAATAPNLTDPKAFDQENKLRDEYVKGSQEFILARDAYSRIQSAAKSPSAAGDIALVFNYMKMLDPKSTVREGEYATAANAGSVPAQIIAKYNAALSGKFLADDVRNDFVNRAGMLYGSYQNAHKKHAKTYSTLASQYKLKPENVALDLEADVPSGSGATGQWGKARVVSP